MNRKVLLIFAGKFYSSPKDKFKHYVPPLGIAHLKSFLEVNKIRVTQADMRLMGGQDELNQLIKKCRPNYLGISALTSEWSMALELIELVKKNYPKIKIVVGGPHATVLPFEVAKTEGVWAVVKGEGEMTALELIKKGKRKGVAGVVYLEKGKVVDNGQREFLKNLDILPFPSRRLEGADKWYMEAYNLFFPMKYPFVNMIVSRGCPGRCAMCQPTLDMIFGAPPRFRSPTSVVREIKQLQKKFKIKSVIFWDDTLTANPQWLKDFCGLINKLNIHIDWWCYSRVNNLTGEVIQMMKKAGCKMICFGIESGSQRVLNYVLCKGTTVEQNKKAIDLCREHKILSNANVMIGSPTETINEVRETDNLLIRTNPDIVWASVTSPLPGTYLGNIARHKGLIRIRSWSEYTRGQIGKKKMKTSLKNRDIVYYQTKWHYTRFRPSHLRFEYYRKACWELIKCHLEAKRPQRLMEDFILGPGIEWARKIYWRNKV